MFYVGSIKKLRILLTWGSCNFDSKSWRWLFC